jgi:two-component system nitrate/nitrite response regulator NarL
MAGEDAKDQKEYVTVLVCKNPLLSMGLELLLASTHFAVSEIKSGADDPPPQRPRLHVQPDLFIVDGSPTAQELLTSIKLLKVQHPNAKIVVVADKFDISFVRGGLDVGIDGFCLATTAREVLIKQLELVMTGEKIVPGVLALSMLSEMTSNARPDQDSAMAALLPSDPGMYRLSPREAEILRGLMRGEPNKVIARNLDVTEATIKVHVKAILRKIGAGNRTQAALWATEHLTKGGKP